MPGLMGPGFEFLGFVAVPWLSPELVLPDPAIPADCEYAIEGPTARPEKIDRLSRMVPGPHSVMPMGCLHGLRSSHGYEVYIDDVPDLPSWNRLLTFLCNAQRIESSQGSGCPLVALVVAMRQTSVGQL